MTRHFNQHSLRCGAAALAIMLGSFAILGELSGTVASASPSRSATITSVSIPQSQKLVMYGTGVQYEVSVTPPGGNPTTGPSGTVVLTSGSTAICTITLDVLSTSGVGECTSTTAPVGNATVVGTYSGDAAYLPSSGSDTLNVTPLDKGYWLVASDGGIFSFGNAPFYGSTGSLRLNKPVVGMAATPDSRGYWLVASDGGIFSFGDAQFHGSTGSLKLNKPIVGMAATSDGGGYWLVASDGGIFAFGDAAFYGSVGNQSLPYPIVGMAATQDAKGYWLADADGEVFTFGDADYSYAPNPVKTFPNNVVGVAADNYTNAEWVVTAAGSMFSSSPAVFYGAPENSNVKLNLPVVGMDGTTDGHGYWIVAGDGGLFAYGDAPYYGSTGSLVLNKPIVGMTASV
jgi:hypothetical protein